MEREHHQSPRAAFAEAVSLLMQENELQPHRASARSRYALWYAKPTRRCCADGIDFAAQAIDARYAWIDRVCKGVTQQKPVAGQAPDLHQ